MPADLSAPLRRDGVSTTAETMALIRALEFIKPPNQSLFCDPYAQRFVPEWQRVLLGLARLPAMRALLEGYFDWKAPGARTSGATRTRLIDDWVREALAAGMAQIVILGAGFDCRALRMKELANIPVFEVDRTPMVALKDRILSVSGEVSGHVHRIGVDFLKDDLSERLSEAGYSSSIQTLFIWEGVTNYLDATSVGAVFDLFARSVPTASRIVFTYVHAGVLDGTFAALGLARLITRLRTYGEPWTFGFLPDEVAAYLARKGIRLVSDLGAADYRAKYRPPVKKPIGYEFYRAVLAEKVANATH